MFGIENFLMAQICGFVAMGITLAAYLQKEDTFVKKFMMVSVFFWGVHYFLLGIMTGVAIIIIWYIRLILSTKYKKSRRSFVFIICITLLSGLYTYSGIISLLPVIASILATYAFFFLEQIRLRISFIGVSLLWLIHNLSIGAIAGILNEIMVQVVLIFTVYRMAHPEGGMRYYSQKIADILLQKSKPDYDRYIFVRDKVSSLRKTLGHHFLEILHYDLRNFLPKRKGWKWNLLSSK
ncbi:YgjV family protein [Candidatus Gracilibacteria bacterium]|nr:YgjV family protein [Candidatus Gracilibacteria bacterium]